MLTRRHTLLILLAGVVCLLLTLGRRTLTEHEVFAAEPGREMLAGQGLILQPFAGEYRTKKPAGQSWLIAASLGISRIQNEWTARLPSALAGIGMAYLVALMAARVGNSRQGLIAGLMTLTCVGVQQRANLAEADMALACCVALANWAMVANLVPSPVYARERIRERVSQTDSGAENAQALSLTLSRGTGRGDKRLAIVFWAGVVGGFMLKGPIVFGFTLFPSLVTWGILRFGCSDRVAATAVRRVAFWWPAVVVGMSLILAWPALAYYEYPAAAAQWKREIVDRVQGDLGHGDEKRQDPLVAYLWLLPQSTLPWIPFAIAGRMVVARLTLWRRPAVVALMSWVTCGMVLVSVIPFKVLHYVLPAIGPVLILAALGFDALLAKWIKRWPMDRREGWRTAAITGWFGVAIVACVVYTGIVLPAKDFGRNVKHFARQVNAVVPPGTTLYLYRVGEERTSWYLSMPLKQTTELPVERPAYLLCKVGELAPVPQAKLLLRAQPYLKRDPPEETRVLVRVD